MWKAFSFSYSDSEDSGSDWLWSGCVQVSSVAFVRSGGALLLASASRDATIALWDFNVS